MNANLYSLLTHSISSRPEAACLIIPGGPDVSRQELLDGAGRLASVLAARGVRPRDRVMVQVPKSPEALMLYLATLKMGAVFAPLNAAYTSSEVDQFIRDAEPKLFVDDVLTLAEEARSHSPNNEVYPSSRDDLAALIYTSGTTGRSKGAMLTHAALAANAIALVDVWRFEEQDRLLHALPIFHVHGLFVATHCALLTGAVMIWLDKFDETDVLCTLPAATVMMGVPTFYTRLLRNSEFVREKTAKIRVFISGSAPLSPSTFEEFEARTGHRILERYGMSEAAIITSNPLDEDRVPGSVGYPLPGVDVRVTPGEVGQIEIKGPSLFSGYWKLPERTDEEFTEDGYFKTGDLGHLDTDGRLWITGRAKELIITGGYNVYPKEIELLLDRCPGVLESAVFGVPASDLGEAVIAAVVLESGCDTSAIMEFLRQKLAGFKIPKRLLAVTALPRNAMGKVQKNALRERFEEAM